MNALQCPLSDDDVLRISARLDLEGWQVEYVGGKIIVSPPAGGETGSRNFSLYRPLAKFAGSHGYIGFDSSTGFRLPNGDVRSPDAALVAISRVEQLSSKERKQFPPLVPDVVVELLSESDDVGELTAKCEMWFAAGAGHVVLLDPQRRRRLTWGDVPEGFPELKVWE